MRRIAMLCAVGVYFAVVLGAPSNASLSLVGTELQVTDASGTKSANLAGNLPDPPCFDNSTRFVNCSNGTVTDTLTGLIWLFDADCFGFLFYSRARDAASGLADGQCGLTDGSRPGDWRLATKEEWDAFFETARDSGP